MTLFQITIEDYDYFNEPINKYSTKRDKVVDWWLDNIYVGYCNKNFVMSVKYQNKKEKKHYKMDLATLRQMLLDKSLSALYLIDEEVSGMIESSVWFNQHKMV